MSQLSQSRPIFVCPFSSLTFFVLTFGTGYLVNCTTCYVLVTIKRPWLHNDGQQCADMITICTDDDQDRRCHRLYVWSWRYLRWLAYPGWWHTPTILEILHEGVEMNVECSPSCPVWLSTHRMMDSYEMFWLLFTSTAKKQKRIERVYLTWFLLKHSSSFPVFLPRTSVLEDSMMS